MKAENAIIIALLILIFGAAAVAYIVTESGVSFNQRDDNLNMSVDVNNTTTETIDFPDEVTGGGSSSGSSYSSSGGSSGYGGSSHSDYSSSSDSGSDSSSSNSGSDSSSSQSDAGQSDSGQSEAGQSEGTSESADFE